MSETEHELTVQGRSTVEYCVNNVTADDRGRVEAAAEKTRGYPCLERCGTCQRESFLVVDGELRCMDSHSHLLALLDGGGADE